MLQAFCALEDGAALALMLVLRYAASRSPGRCGCLDAGKAPLVLLPPRRPSCARRIVVDAGAAQISRLVQGCLRYQR